MRLDNGDEDACGDGEGEMGIGPILYLFCLRFAFFSRMLSLRRSDVEYARCPIGNSPRCRGV